MLNSNMFSCYLLRALLQIKQRALREAVPDIEAIRKLVGNGGPPHRIGELGYLYGQIGRDAEALRLLDDLRKRAPTQYVPAAAIGNIYLGLNRREDALTEFERAFGQHDVWMIWLKVHPLYDDIRSHPRFQELIKRMNFSD